MTYPDSFRLEEAKSLVESLQNKIVKVFTQKYLDRAEYGMGSGKAEEIKNFVKEHSANEIQQIIVDEHPIVMVYPLDQKKEDDSNDSIFQKKMEGLKKIVIENSFHKSLKFFV